MRSGLKTGKCCLKPRFVSVRNKIQPPDPAADTSIEAFAEGPVFALAFADSTAFARAAADSAFLFVELDILCKAHSRKEAR